LLNFHGTKIDSKVLKEEEFRRLKLRERYKVLTEKGTFLANRVHAGFQCRLYDLFGFYVEVWRPAGINVIQWIEVVNRDEIIDSYLENFDID